MKPNPTPHDLLDELLAAAVHGELTADQRVEFEARLQHDPAARAACQEIQTMHDLLERNHREIQPDPAFEERMISGVRRKVREEKAHRETAWESVLVLWRALKWPLVARPGWTFAALGVACVVLTLGFIYGGQRVWAVFATINGQLQSRSLSFDQTMAPITTAAQPVGSLQPGVTRPIDAQNEKKETASDSTAKRLDEEQAQATQLKQGFASARAEEKTSALSSASANAAAAVPDAPLALTRSGEQSTLEAVRVFPLPASPSNAPAGTTTGTVTVEGSASGRIVSAAGDDKSPADSESVAASSSPDRLNDLHGQEIDDNQKRLSTTPSSIPAISNQSARDLDWKPLGQPAAAAPASSRKLIRDAALDLEVKNFQATVDAIATAAKAAGGYLDSSSSQRGGNGKLQGQVVAKVAPGQLDAFLLKLRGLGTLKNQSVSTEDVTKDYIDTQARIENSQKMETQLQLLLQHSTNKVADLLEVERELGRVRGEIEQMQGQLKLYDFQVEYATVTINVQEKDLNKAAAYLLQEHDQFSLFARNVEEAFDQAKAAAATFKAQILNADLQHDSGGTMSATLAFSVPPDQVDGFLAKVKALGRVDNFTRTTTRIANDGGTSDEPADETRTDRDNAQVQLTIRADDESPRQQTQLTVASTGDIDAQAQQLKDDAARSGAAVTASSFERAPDGTETAAIAFRLALAKTPDFLLTLEKLGRVESLSVQRNDQPGQAAADANAPAEIDLRLHNVAAVSFENEAPRQQTEVSIVSSGDVNAQALQLKSDALKAGMAVTASTFRRSPDGTEEANLTLRLPLAQAAAFTDTLKKFGKVESLAVQRNDVPGPDSTDPNAPAEISLDLHSPPDVIAEDRGLWPTLRHLLGGSVTAFLDSAATIGVLLAFLAPWIVTLVFTAWVGRRVWVRRKKVA